MYRADSFDQSSRSVIDPSTGLVQTQALIPSTSNTYGALGIGISANGTKGDGTGEKKKKASPGSRSLYCPLQILTEVTHRRPEWRRASLSAETGESIPGLASPCCQTDDVPFRSGTVESPEWRKGPDGPKSLCNACGLRYAKLVSKTKKEQREGKK